MQWFEVALQLADFKILKEIFVFQSDQSAIDSIRWLHKMEALLEAGPQSLLQLVYILRPSFRRGKPSSALVYVSLLSGCFYIL